MKPREHSELPEEVIQDFQNGTPEALKRAERIWGLLGDLDEEPGNIPSLEAAWDDLESRIDQPKLSQKVADRRPQKAKRTGRSWFKATSFAVASVALLAFAFFSFQNTSIVRVAQHGQQLSVKLPDGSSVLLKSGAELAYARGFGKWSLNTSKERRVILDGEAYFQVEPGEVPFTVKTFNASITVLGTEFNVRAYEDESEQATLVTLDHGRVQVSADDAGGASTIISNPGENVRVKNEELDSGDQLNGEFPLELVTAWKNNGFVAIDLSLESLLKEIERHYNVEIQVSPAFSLESTNLIYSTSSPTIENLLRDYCLSQSCKFQQNGSGYLLLPLE